jgi:hypothetical protein
VLLVHGLLAHVELVRDLLPRPAEVSRSRYLERLDLLGEPAQGCDGAETDLRVPAPGRLRESGRVRHIVKIG